MPLSAEVRNRYTGWCCAPLTSSFSLKGKLTPVGRAAETDDFLVAAGLLAGELVAGEAGTLTLSGASLNGDGDREAVKSR
jgi:hypothetical protein